jgi:Transglycosylase SLT domain/SPOR domain
MTRSCGSPVRQKVSNPALLRALGSLAALAFVSACATRTPTVNQTQEAARYAARARGNYVAPGSSSDPWGPYISEAAQRFDVPERWIREVMRVESGGKMYQEGRLITSWAGAMGLMQVMPETYDELRARYDLGDDAYDPHNNVLAGAAYIREMYDIYGSPGFLAAYNAGPKRLDDYLSNTRGLPDETRRYVAMIGPYVVDSHPVNRSPAEDYAMNALPIDIPPGTRYGRAVQVASRSPAGRRSASRGSTQVAQLAEPRRTAGRSSVQPAAAPQAETPRRGRGGFQLISSAVAEPLPLHHGGAMSGGWAVQVGAFGNESQAHAAAGVAKQRAHEPLGAARPTVVSVSQGRAKLWRARLTGLSRNSAVEACEKLNRSRTGCIVLSPDAQS